jgi:hypothetical protein
VVVVEQVILEQGQVEEQEDIENQFLVQLLGLEVH